MSASLIDRLVDAAHLDMSREAVRRVQDMVASGKAERKCCWTDREWMLEVVANEFNGVDVDKARACVVCVWLCVFVRVCVWLCAWLCVRMLEVVADDVNRVGADKARAAAWEGEGARRRGGEGGEGAAPPDLAVAPLGLLSSAAQCPASPASDPGPCFLAV